MSVISVGLVDDDQLIVSLLDEFLKKKKDIKVIHKYGSGEDFLEVLSVKNQPDVLVLDLSMKGKNGIEVTEFLNKNYPDIRVIVMSSHYKLSFMGFMLKTGVSAFLPKGVSPQELLKVIQEVYERNVYFLPEQLDTIRGQVSPKSPKPNLDENSLSEREIDVLKLICQQKTAKEIADILFITQRTVEGHKSNLFLKTFTKNIAGLVVYAIQHKIVDVDEILLV